MKGRSLYRRLGVATAGIVVGLAAWASPAFGHEEINPKVIKTGTPTFLILSAANEEKVPMTKVTLVAPDGVPFGEATRQAAGWTLTSKDDHTIVWTADPGGGLPPEGFEQWGFETEGADQPGDATYKVTLSFADGTNNGVDVVVGATATGQSATAAAPSSTNGMATAAIVVSVGGMILAVLAILLGTRRGRPAEGDGSW